MTLQDRQMQLLSSPTSPYARKVRICLIELGLGDRVSVTDANPMGEDGVVAAANPLGKIPALVRPGESAIFDSTVICEYLDAIAGGGRLFPTIPSSRFDALVRHALAQGVMDAAFSLVMEARREEAARSAYWMSRWADAIRRGLLEMSKREEADPTPVDIGWIAQAAAVGYVEFRLPHLADPEGSGALRKWWLAAQVRPSVAATRPPG
jgi:glutathione S-transferase